MQIVVCLGFAKSFWSDELTQLKQKSLDAHNLWKSCNCPRNGPILMKRFVVTLTTNHNYENQNQMPIMNYLLIIYIRKTVILFGSLGIR